MDTRSFRITQHNERYPDPMHISQLPMFVKDAGEHRYGASQSAIGILRHSGRRRLRAPKESAVSRINKDEG